MLKCVIAKLFMMAERNNKPLRQRPASFAAGKNYLRPAIQDAALIRTCLRVL
jgi:hypothetical protein